jgi:hypothetical protein
MTMRIEEEGVDDFVGRSLSGGQSADQLSIVLERPAVPILALGRRWRRLELVGGRRLGLVGEAGKTIQRGIEGAHRGGGWTLVVEEALPIDPDRFVFLK